MSLKVWALTIIGNCCTITPLPTDLNVLCTMMLNVGKIISNLGQPDPQKWIELTGLKEILEASEMCGLTQIEGNTKIGILKFAVKI